MGAKRKPLVWHRSEAGAYHTSYGDYIFILTNQMPNKWYLRAFMPKRDFWGGIPDFFETKRDAKAFVEDFIRGKAEQDFNAIIVSMA